MCLTMCSNHETSCEGHVIIFKWTFILVFVVELLVFKNMPPCHMKLSDSCIKCLFIFESRLRLRSKQAPFASPTLFVNEEIPFSKEFSFLKATNSFSEHLPAQERFQTSEKVKICRRNIWGIGKVRDVIVSQFELTREKSTNSKGNGYIERSSFRKK